MNVGRGLSAAVFLCICGYLMIGGLAAASSNDSHVAAILFVGSIIAAGIGMGALLPDERRGSDGQGDD
jgi:predicted lysophospholipase L1 biosynthesis ABC-type transport system permease subunit